MQTDIAHVTTAAIRAPLHSLDSLGFRIHDEVRKVAPGLSLGPAPRKGAKGKALVRWSALDSRPS